MDKGLLSGGQGKEVSNRMQLLFLAGFLGNKYPFSFTVIPGVPELSFQVDRRKAKTRSAALSSARAQDSSTTAQISQGGLKSCGVGAGNPPS